jgi:hypothetical protein
MIPGKPTITSKRVAPSMPMMEEEDRKSAPDIEGMSLEELQGLRDQIDQKIAELESGDSETAEDQLPS